MPVEVTAECYCCLDIDGARSLAGVSQPISCFEGGGLEVRRRPTTRTAVSPTTREGRRSRPVGSGG